MREAAEFPPAIALDERLLFIGVHQWLSSLKIHRVEQHPKLFSMPGVESLSSVGSVSSFNPNRHRAEFIGLCHRQKQERLKTLDLQRNVAGSCKVALTAGAAGTALRRPAAPLRNAHWVEDKSGAGFLAHQRE